MGSRDHYIDIEPTLDKLALYLYKSAVRVEGARDLTRFGMATLPSLAELLWLALWVYGFMGGGGAVQCIFPCMAYNPKVVHP